VNSKKALAGFHHVKLPVRDLPASIEWYTGVLGLAVAIEFVEAGVLRGVALQDPGATLTLALREDPERAAHLSGFDPIALAVPGVADLNAWVSHLDELGVAHSPIAEGSVGWLVGGLTDPDGIEIRLYTLATHDPSGR
jgi:catechol 2,3-dioxygenase-like lactoylglutathione lyase family enzyme